jgi:hypothetical protein
VPGIFSLLGNALIAPTGRFLYNYFERFGCLDGREGFLLHMYQSVYMSWSYAKQWELGRSSPVRSDKAISI